MNRVRIRGLQSFEYEHPTDRAALDYLRKIPVVPNVIDAVQTQSNNTIRTNMLGNNVRVTEKQFPSIYRLMREACEVLDVEEPLFYLSSDPELNAYTSCPDKPIVCISGYLLDMLDDDETLFVIGHELSHIKSRHLTYSVIGSLITMGVLQYVLPFGGNTVEAIVRYAYCQWERAGEYSCDRGGYLACQNFEASCKALMKIAGFSKRYMNELNITEFIKQGEGFEDIDENQLGKIQKIIFSHSSSSHPWTVARVKQLLKYRESGQYDSVLQRMTQIDKKSDMDNLSKRVYYESSHLPELTTESAVVDPSIQYKEKPTQTRICGFCQKDTDANNPICVNCGLSSFI